MKKTLLTLLAAVTLAPAMAQVGVPNSWILYGSGSYSSMRGEINVAPNTTVDFPRTLTYSVAPGLGYQFTDRFAAGINFELYGSKTDFRINNIPGEDEMIRTRNLYVGPFVRYTQPLGEHFFWFGQADFSYISGKDRITVSGNPDIENEIDYNGVRGRFFPSVGVRVSPTVGLAFNVGGIQYEYVRTDFGANVEGKESALDVTFGQVFGFTLQKYFGGNRIRSERQPMDETRRINTDDEDDE